MSTPSTEDVRRKRHVARAQMRFVEWLDRARDELDGIIGDIPADEDYDAGRVAMVRDLLAGIVSDERERGRIWISSADSALRGRESAAYLDALDVGWTHEQAEENAARERARCLAGEE